MPLLYGMRPSTFRALAKVYNAECKQSRERLPQAHNCKVQLEIDQAVCQHTDFSYKLYRQARHLLSHEPMVTNQHYNAQQPQPRQSSLLK